MANARTLQQKYKPQFEAPRNSVPRLHKVQYRNQQYFNERSQDLHMCHQKPRTGHILDWKTNESQNMSTNIYDYIFIYFFHMLDLSVQNMPKLYG